MARRTVAASGTFTGTGLHTGATTTVRFTPAEPGTGIVFRRTDLPGTADVPARLSAVSATERRTAIGDGDAAIHTIEHLLAAIAAWEIDDLVIEIDGPEVPAGDGSFAVWSDLLQTAGVAEIDGEPAVLAVRAPFTVTEGDAGYLVAPAAELRLTTTIEWDHPLIGRQTGDYRISPDLFGTELARARTFGFTHEVEALREAGLGLGATTDNAVVLDPTGVVGTELRWPDEFLRHKAGDILGDLALLGARIRAHIVATRPSHRGNIALARALERITGHGAALSIDRILEVIPHRYPMLLVDRILEVHGVDRIVGLKNVTFNEPFFQGHFPGHPIMPGVLIVEAMAQVGGFLLLGSVERPADKVVYFMAIDGVRFRRPVVPGDQLRFELEMLQNRGRTCRMRGTAWVDGQLVAEAEMMARVVDR